MLSHHLIQVAAQSYDFDPGRLRFIAPGREAQRSFYGFARGGGDYVLRVVQGPAGQISQMRAEMDWIRYLAEQGLNVSAPVPTVNGESVLLAEENGESYLLSAFHKARGRQWDKNNPSLWNERIFHQWGKTMGDMHRVTKDYKAVAGQERRKDYSNIILHTVASVPSVNSAAREVVKEIESLPRDRDSYGLIHNDLHPGNFMIDGDQISVFDFADCIYGWYAMDIGIALAVGLWLGHASDSGTDFTNSIIKHFLEGYQSANTLRGFWRSKIPLFMRLCQLSLFSCTYDSEIPHDAVQREQIYNIEHHIFLTGCGIDGSLFHWGG